MCGRDIGVPHQHVFPRSEDLNHWLPKGRELDASFHSSSLRPLGTLIDHSDLKCCKMSRSTWNVEDIQEVQLFLNSQNLPDRIGGGKVSLTIRYVK